jgi:hypothetical protein
VKSREECDVPGLLDCEDETSVNVYQSTRSNITGDINRKPFSVSAFVQAITKCYVLIGSVRSICSNGHKMLCSNGSVRSICSNGHKILCSNGSVRSICSNGHKMLYSNGSVRSVCSNGHKILCPNGSVRSISTPWKSPGPLS